MWPLRAWNSQTQLQYSYISSIYEGCTQMWGIIKTPARLLKCYAVFGVLAQLSTFPELLPLTKPGLLANKLNRPTQGLFSSAEWLGPSGPTANGSLNINLCPHVSAIYRLYFISNRNNKCEALYLQNWKNRGSFFESETQTNLFGFTTTGWFGCTMPSAKIEDCACVHILDSTFALNYQIKIFQRMFHLLKLLFWGKQLIFKWQCMQYVSNYEFF